MDAPIIPPWILLLVAEQADLASISALMRTSKSNCSLLRTYERSITKEKAKKFILPPTGSLLASADEEREPIRPHSFASLRELSRRDTRMDCLLAAGFLSTDRPERLGMTPTQMDLFRLGLKRGMCIVDHIADLEGDLLPSSTTNNPPIAANRGAPGRQSGEMLEELLHTRRVQYLHTLDTLDLAWVSQLTEAARAGYFRYKQPELLGDPTTQEEKLIAFQETIMRSGSFVIFAFVRGSVSLSLYVKRRVSEIRTEMTSWQTTSSGKVREGLHATMMRILRRRLAPADDGNDEDDGDNVLAVRRAQKLNDEMRKMIYTAIGVV